MPGLKLLVMMGFSGDYGKVGHTDPNAYLDEAARARRHNPLIAFVEEYGERPVSEGERQRVVEELARAGVLDEETAAPGE